MPCASRTINKKQLTINNKLETPRIHSGRAVNSKLVRENRGLLFKIYSFKLAIGFTLVELLVVMGILGVITGAALLFLTSILRGSNQARIVAEVKQNGQTVLDVIDRQIRNAQSVRELAPIDGSISAIELTLTGTSKIYLGCYNEVTLPKKNGWIGILNSPIVPSAATDFLSLTNIDTVSGINIECTADTFNVSGSSGDSYPQVIQVEFNVRQGVEAPGRVDFNASAEFKTTISLRKYSF